MIYNRPQPTQGTTQGMAMPYGIKVDHKGPLVLIKMDSNGFLGKIHYADLFSYLHWGRIVVKTAKKNLGLAKKINASGILSDPEEAFIRKPIKPISQESAAIVLRDPSFLLKEYMGISVRENQVSFFLTGNFHLSMTLDRASIFLKALRINARLAKNSQRDGTIYSTAACTPEEAEDNFREGKQHF